MVSPAFCSGLTLNIQAVPVSDQIGDNKNQNHDNGYDNNYRFPAGDLVTSPFRATIGITP